MDSKETNNKSLVRAQALVLVSMLIVAGSIAMAPAVFAQLDLIEPYNIIGFVLQEGNPLEGITVTVINTRTSSTFTDVTDSEGRYDVDIADIGIGYRDGDLIYAITEEPNQGFGSGYVDVSGLPYLQINVIIDRTDPVIGVTTVNKEYINTQGTFGGTPPPVAITTTVTDDNLAAAAWGIRDEFQDPSPTMYFTYDITNDVMPSTQLWDGNMYFIDGVIVTVTMSDTHGTDMVVFGELDGTGNPEDVIGYDLPSHYAVFSAGQVTIYETNGTLDTTHHEQVTLGGGEVFRAYRFDEGTGYVVTAAATTYVLGEDNWIVLNPQPVPDGRYAVCVSAMDWAGNTAWTNETDGNPVITVDNYAPIVTATGPDISDVRTFDVTYDFEDVIAPNGATPSPVVNVTLWYRLDGGAWTLYGDDPTPGNGLFTVDLTQDGTYDWYMISYDAANNHDQAGFTIQATTIVDSLAPVIVDIIADKEYISSTGTYGGTMPPVTIETEVVEANLLVASIGIRNNYTTDNTTFYATYAFNDLTAIWGWDGQWHFLGTELITLLYTDVDVVVMGELNGLNNTDDVLGRSIVPSHYARWSGTMWSFYETHGSLDDTQHTLVDPNPADVFKPYRFDDGIGYIVGGEYTNPDSMVLNSYPIVDGDYRVVVGAADVAENYVVAEGPAITVDNYAPIATATGPETSNVHIFDITYDFQNVTAPNGATPSPVVNVTLWYSLDGGAWTWYGEITENFETGLFPVDLTLLGDGIYDWYMISYDMANNHDQGGFVIQATTIVNTQAPEIVLTVPYDGENGVALNQPIVITFSEAINTTTITYTCTPDPGGWIAAWTEGDTVLTLTHADFAEFTLYEFVVTFAEDMYGNELVAGIVPNPWSFTTAGTLVLGYSAGWNLISIPVLNPEIGGIPLTHASNFTEAEMVSMWDPVNQGYISFIPDFHTPGGSRDFAILVDFAYWIWMPDVGTLNIDGNSPGARSVALEGPGWNMIGYLSLDSGDAEVDWVAPNEFVTAVAYYDAGAFVYKFLPETVMQLVPGRGYFVWATEDTTLVYGS